MEMNFLPDHNRPATWPRLELVLKMVLIRKGNQLLKQGGLTPTSRLVKIRNSTIFVGIYHSGNHGL